MGFAQDRGLGNEGDHYLYMTDQVIACVRLLTSGVQVCLYIDQLHQHHGAAWRGRFPQYPSQGRAAAIAAGPDGACLHQYGGTANTAKTR